MTPLCPSFGSLTLPSPMLPILHPTPARPQADYAYIRSYSPYEHVAALAAASPPAPALLLTCALHDSRVPYWGPAKFVARLRSELRGRMALDEHGPRETEEEADAGVLAMGCKCGPAIESAAVGGGCVRFEGGVEGEGREVVDSIRLTGVLLLTETGAGGHFASGALGERAMRSAFLLQRVASVEADARASTRRGLNI